MPLHIEKADLFNKVVRAGSAKDLYRQAKVRGDGLEQGSSLLICDAGVEQLTEIGELRSCDLPRVKLVNLVKGRGYRSQQRLM